MKISKIFSTRTLLLVAFILVVLFLVTSLNITGRNEPFVEGARCKNDRDCRNSTYNKCKRGECNKP